jgi:hypothetical protein
MKRGFQTEDGSQDSNQKKSKNSTSVDLTEESDGDDLNVPQKFMIAETIVGLDAFRFNSPRNHQLIYDDHFSIPLEVDCLKIHFDKIHFVRVSNCSLIVVLKLPLDDYIFGDETPKFRQKYIVVILEQNNPSFPNVVKQLTPKSLFTRPKTNHSRLLRRINIRTSHKKPPPKPDNIQDLLPLLPDVKYILVYPENEKGSVSITPQDFNRLEPGEYLNDVLIDFFIKYIQRELIPEDTRNNFHCFSSYFYSSLTSPSIRKWTRNINLFEKKFILVPINEHFHWKLAIIHNPGNEDTEPSHDRSCIILFDSLGMETPYSPIIEALRKYLTDEWFAQFGTRRVFNQFNTVGYVPDVPLQTNAIDCGVYLLKFAQRFCMDPPTSFKDESVIARGINRSWFDVTSIPFLRKYMKKLILKKVRHSIN